MPDTRVHFLSLDEDEAFRLNQGGPLWQRAPDRITSENVRVARFVQPDGLGPIDARHLPRWFVYRA